MATFQTTITREKVILGAFGANLGDGEVEIAIDVEYTVSKGCRGHCDKYGAPEEPDTPDELEIASVIDTETGNEIELTEEELMKIEQKIWDSLD